jgi:hypothetical protein
MTLPHAPRANRCRVLNNNLLSGPIPLALGSITTLTNLVLSSNTLYGSLPDLSTLKSLINMCAPSAMRFPCSCLRARTPTPCAHRR